MNRLLILPLAALCAATALTAPAFASSPAPVSARAAKGLATAELKVTGMHCDGCAMGVTNRLKQVTGVKSAKVSYKTSVATVQYDPSACKPADLLAAVKRAGYVGSLKK